MRPVDLGFSDRPGLLPGALLLRRRRWLRGLLGCFALLALHACTIADRGPGWSVAPIEDLRIREVEVYGRAAATIGTRLRYPVSLAGDAGSIFVADAGAGRLYRIDRAAGSEFDAIGKASTGTQLFLDRDRTVWLADPRRGTLLQIDEDGRVVARPEEGTVRRPQDVAVSGRPRSVWVLDVGRNRLLQLDVLGGTLAALGGVGSGLPGGAGWQDIAATRERIYVLDGVGGVWSLQLAAGGPGRATELIDASPGARALAVDDCGRIYRGEAGGRLGIHGSAGTVDRRLPVEEITDLWWSRGELFVADAPGASVHIYEVVPACP